MDDSDGEDDGGGGASGWQPAPEQLASLRALVQLALVWSVGGSLDAGVAAQV